MLNIAKWYNNYQSPSVLMIDDLSDAYINIYEEEYKNDWGYFCNNENSSFRFLQEELLKKFPKIKITFFVPYLKHNVINDNTKVDFKKHYIGEREEFSSFLKYLINLSHEIAHHGSNHGQYINKGNLSTVNNFKHEWELFDDIEEGVKITNQGKEIFKDTLSINLSGGKYCGYKEINNSKNIIDKSNFLYWSDKINFNTKKYAYNFFGKNNIISFPTNFSGNAFVRLSYITGDTKKDRIKSILKFLQPIYNIKEYLFLYKLYKNGEIISIQEHISPSTSSGIAQSANIISDIESLKKIYSFLSNKSIWYETCENIAKYIYTKENTTINETDEKIFIRFNNYKMLEDCKVSLESKNYFELINNENIILKSIKSNNKFVINLKINHEITIFKRNI